jgi:O-antigen ligase
MSVLKFPFVLMYRILVMFVGIFFLPAAYAMRGKFLRGIVVTVLLIIAAVLTGGIALVILYPMAVIDAGTA